MIELIGKYWWIGVSLIVAASIAIVGLDVRLFPMVRTAVTVETYVAEQGKWVEQGMASLSRPCYAYAKFKQGYGLVRMEPDEIMKSDFGIIRSNFKPERFDLIVWQNRIDENLYGISLLPSQYSTVPPSVPEIEAIELKKFVPAEKGIVYLASTKRGVFKLRVKDIRNSVVFEPLRSIFPGLFGRKVHYHGPYDASSAGDVSVETSLLRSKMNPLPALLRAGVSGRVTKDGYIKTITKDYGGAEIETQKIK